MKKKRFISEEGEVFIFVFSLLFIFSLFIDSFLFVFFNYNKNIVLDYFFTLLSYYLLIPLLYILVSVFTLNRIFIKRFFSGFIVSIPVTVILKYLFLIERPLGIKMFYDFTNILSYSSPSFPAVVLFSGYPILKRYYTKIGFFWLIISILISISGVYFGTQHFSDVTLGMLTGYIIGEFILYLEK